MKVAVVLLCVLAGLYVLLCGALYFKQEKLLFGPTVLPAGYRFRFPGRFEERWATAADGTRLHGLLFKTSESKGLVFYLHGNGGALDSWGEVAATYTALHYDVFLLDYRGYGKSGGIISNQGQMLADVDTVYRQLLSEYPERRTVVLGYSLGTGPATWLAARHRPKLLVLQAPYFSMRDMAAQRYPYVPGFVLRYPMPTNELITQVSAPIVLFHGDRDEVISTASSRRLMALLKPSDELVILRGAGHNGMSDFPQYRQALARVLE